MLVSQPLPGAPRPPIPPSPVLIAPVVIQGPSEIHIGQAAHFTSTSNSTQSLLCYKHGTSRVRCSNDWTPVIQSGRDQYFTVRINGEVFARLIYHDVS